jgi:hypothetical protein
MEKKPTITLRLDTRSKLKSGGHPIKLSVYYNGEQKTVSPTKPLSATKDEYAAIVSNHKLSTSKLRKLRDDTDEQKAKENEVAKALTTFSFAAFKRDLHNQYSPKKAKRHLGKDILRRSRKAGGRIEQV